MIESFKRNLYLIGSEHRPKWLMLIALGVSVSVVEAIGALLLFTLLGAMALPDTEVAIPLLGSVKEVLSGQDRATSLLVLGMFVALFFIFRGALSLFQSYAQNRIAQSAGARLATRLMGRYLRMPYTFHLERNSSELIRNLHGSTYEWVGTVLIPAISFFSEGLVVLAIGTVLAIKAPLASAFTALAVAPVVLILIKALQPRLLAMGAENLEMNQRNLQSQQQSFRAVRDIKLLAKEQYFEEEFNRSRINAARTYYLRSTFIDAPRLVVETVLVLFVVGFLALSIVRDQSLDEALAVLGLFGYAVVRILPSFNRVMSSINNIRFGSPSVDVLYEDLKLVEAMEDGAEPDIDPGTTALPFTRQIDVRGVSFGYHEGDGLILEDVDLTIKKGSSIGIVGPTGSGKSTLLDLLLGLLQPLSGQITVDSVDIATDLRRWQMNLGVVSQNVALIDDSLRRNVALGVDDDEIDSRALERAIRVAQLEDFVGTLPEGLETSVGESGIRLSGGQRQRVAIARALYRDPPVLVLDEGTSALDSRTERELLDAIEPLRGDKTIIMVAHRLSTVESCDRVVVMDRGRIEERDPSQGPDTHRRSIG